jgi:MerR family transcriptional regulator/heat shock protein HspR
MVHPSAGDSTMNDPGCEPVFIISVAARLLEMHPQTLRKYEREGLIAPSRTTGNLRLYSDEDLDRLRQVKHLVNERGLNLAGVQLILELTRHMQALQAQLASQAATEPHPALEQASADLASLLRMLGANTRQPGEQGRSNGSRS